MARPTSSHSQPQAVGGKAAEDTIAGCLARAAADLARAAEMGTPNARERLETSAASWHARAALLQQTADDSDANRALAVAEWKAGEDAARFAPSDDEAEAPGSARA